MRVLARAFIAHRTPTRIRIKLASARSCGDLARLKQLLLEQPDVLAAHLNSMTGSLIIECRKGFEPAAQLRQVLGLELPEAGRASSVRYRRARAAAKRESNRPSGALILAHVLKLIVAISTRQLGTQLIEWAADGLIQAARRHGRAGTPLISASFGDPRPL